MTNGTGAALSGVLESHRAEVESALAAIQLDLFAKLTLDALVAPASDRGVTVVEVLIEQLDAIGRLDDFVEALRAREVNLGDSPAEIADDRVDARFQRFAARADQLACRVLVDHEVKGSGCFVGPSLVLTAWHVIASKAPNAPDPTAKNVEVQLHDGTKHPARIPPAFLSLCGDEEYAGTAPASDAEVVDRNDVALLALQRPAAAHLDFAMVPATPPRTSSNLLWLLDFPKGQAVGTGLGRTRKMAGVTARWRHDIKTDKGSSGGLAFGTNREMLGIHQARWGIRGRLVPAWVFLDDVRTFIENDRAPMSLWALDRASGDRLILGRDGFFLGVRAAGRDVTRIRGVWIKRRGQQAEAAGLGFSYELLVQLLARKGLTHRPVRIPFEEVIRDLEVEMRRRLAAAGIDIPDQNVPTGVELGQAALEAVMKDRSRLLASAIDTVAHTRDEIVWLFFDTPTVPLSEAARLFFEGFVASALYRHRLRLIVAGFETATLAGAMFNAPADADGTGEPGFLVEFLGGFTLQDIRNLLRDASTDLLGEVDDAVDTIAETAFGQVPTPGGVVRDADLETVLDALRPTIALWIKKAGIT